MIQVATGRRIMDMSNLTTIQTIYEAFGRGDVPTILDLCADDVAWEHWDDNWAQKKGIPILQARTGKAGVGEFFAGVATLTLQSFEVLNMMEGGDQVAATFVIEYDTPVGGHLRDEEIHLWTLNAAGEVCGLRHYVDTAKHLAAWKL
ncbi:MAG: nuclear transport factor 2 family protein [Acidimicrobiia bacterium]|nr:nuclear transport factor 2 family protein [Acidimicrobiia bacterium]